MFIFVWSLVNLFLNESKWFKMKKTGFSVHSYKLYSWVRSTSEHSVIVDLALAFTDHFQLCLVDWFQVGTWSFMLEKRIRLLSLCSSRFTVNITTVIEPLFCIIVSNEKWNKLDRLLLTQKLFIWTASWLIWLRLDNVLFIFLFFVFEVRIYFARETCEQIKCI